VRLLDDDGGMEEERRAHAGQTGSPGDRLAAVDGLRAIAVLAVVAHHAGLLPLEYGTRGVDLFFVISGFCLSLPTLRSMQAGNPFRFDRWRFARGRVARIVPPYYVALVLFGVLSLTAFGLPSVVHPATRFEWLENALFMTSPAPAYNASFWTLGIEAQWYVLFPAILSLYVRSKSLFCSVAVFSYLAFAWHHELVDIGVLPCFMLGIVAAHLYVSGKASSPLFPVLAFVSLVTAVLTDPTAFHGHPIWHVAAFAMLVAGVGRLHVLASWRPLAAIGVASYSIYLVHQPIVLWLMRYDIAWPVCGLLGVGAGLVFWLAVEQPALAWQAEAKQRRRSVRAVAV
jgi:peptidoglycan/LPS O-acetylase OafA/YrhL